MHSGFRIPGIQHQHEPSAENSSASSMLLSMNQTRHEDDDNLLEQIHRGTIPNTAHHHHQLFMNNHGLFPPPPHPHHHHPSRVDHHYVGPTTAGVAPSAFFPLSFKLGLSEYCSRNNNIHEQERCCTSSYSNNNQVRVRTGSINEGHGDDDGDDDAALVLLRGSEQYGAVPETRHASIGMLHCWQNQEDSAIKQPPFWEAEASNENSEIVDRQDNSEMNNKPAQAEAKSRVHFGELEAIYKRQLGSTTAESDQTGPVNEPVNTTTHLVPHHHHQAGLLDHGSENSIGEHHHHHQQQQQESASIEMSTRKRKKKKKKSSTHDVMIDPMTEFFGNLVKQVMEHQENLHKKFSEAVERLDEERRRREEAWRSQELAHFEREAAERARERDLAESREAAVISYLEKITGEKINLPPKFDPKS